VTWMLHLHWNVHTALATLGAVNLGGAACVE
jgi:hypothetical protein